MFKASLENRLLIVKERFIDYLVSSVYIIEKIKMNRDLAELLAVDLDGLGMHYLMQLDSEKYLKLWTIKSKMYIDTIREQS